MQYHEYLNSARKHQYTCEEVLKLIKGIELTSGEGKSRHKRLLLNLYYLSGYVVECSVKYAIYHLIAYDRKKMRKAVRSRWHFFPKQYQASPI